MKAPSLPERRRIPISAACVTLRAAVEAPAGDPAPAAFIGYPAKFDERTAIGNPLTWGFYEEVAPGTFTKTLQEGDARFLVDHDTRMVVSRMSAGTLRLAQDKVGLAADSDLDQDLSYVRDLQANLRNGNITGMSFGFEVIKDEWSKVPAGETDDGAPIEAELRRILEVKLYEVSAVTFPAYESTEAALRSVAAALIRRGDEAALAAHTDRRRDLAETVARMVDREPVTATHGKDAQPGRTTALSLDDRLHALSVRYGLTMHP